MPNIHRVHYPESGNFLVIDGGQKIARYDGDTLYFWNGKSQSETPVSLALLAQLVSGAPEMTASPRGRDGARGNWRYEFPPK